MKILITRGFDGAKQILGQLQVIDDCKVICSLPTLELPYLGNSNNISSIIPGIYKAKKYNSNKNGECILLEDVPNRSMIEIHAGNYYYDIAGCVLVGEKYSDINNDGFLDVINSRNSLDYLLSLIPDNFEIEIR